MKLKPAVAGVRSEPDAKSTARRQMVGDNHWAQKVFALPGLDPNAISYHAHESPG